MFCRSSHEFFRLLLQWCVYLRDDIQHTAHSTPPSTSVIHTQRTKRIRKYQDAVLNLVVEWIVMVGGDWL